MRYADDDAIKLAAILNSLSVRTRILTELDQDSAALYSQAKVQGPSRKHVLKALHQAILLAGAGLGILALAAGAVTT